MSTLPHSAWIAGQSSAVLQMTMMISMDVPQVEMQTFIARPCFIMMMRLCRKMSMTPLTPLEMTDLCVDRTSPPSLVFEELDHNCPVLQACLLDRVVEFLDQISTGLGLQFKRQAILTLQRLCLEPFVDPLHRFRS